MRLEVGVRGVGCAALAGMLMASVSTAALAAKAPDPREARLEQLEAEIQQLKSDNQRSTRRRARCRTGRTGCRARSKS